MDVQSLTNSSASPANALLPESLRGLRVHFIGIGGSGMCGLAEVLASLGARVTGSDSKASVAVQRMLQRGWAISTSQTAASFPRDAQMVVASAAIPQAHPEIEQAQSLGIPIVKYARMLGAVMERRQGIAISGTHGKSTTTAMLTHVLHEAGLDPSFVVGASCRQLGGSSASGSGPYFVAEACEFDRSFLNLRPKAAVILGIEEDHLDYYRNLDEIVAAFEEFAGLIPRAGLLVVNGADAHAMRATQTAICRVETFGLGERFTWSARNLNQSGGRYQFDVWSLGACCGAVRLGIPGRHNVLNALAVVALARQCGVPWDSLFSGLESFRGIDRRLEWLGQFSGVDVADDYAHHPTEIRVTLEAARERFSPRRLWCVFQPHQHSRTRFLLEDFARCFQAADFVVLPDIYFVRDSQRDREAVSAADLAQRISEQGGDAAYIPGFEGILAYLLQRVQPGDLVITMGAGNIGKVAHDLAARLGGDLSY